MKKLLLVLLMLIPIKCFAVDFNDLQHYVIDPDTTAIHTDLRLRGSFYLYDDITTLILSDATASVIISSTIKTGTTQGNAGAAAGEFWVDSDDDFTIKFGQ